MHADLAALMSSRSPDALILLTTDGQVVHWSEGAQAIFGYAADEVRGKAFTELIVAPPRSWSARRAAWPTSAACPT